MRPWSCLRFLPEKSDSFLPMLLTQGPLLWVSVKCVETISIEADANQIELNWTELGGSEGWTGVSED